MFKSISVFMILFLKFSFFTVVLFDQNFPEMVEEDLQIFQNDEDFFNSVSDLQASIVTLTDILDIDLYDVCAKDGKYENVLFSLLKLKLCMFDVIF